MLYNFDDTHLLSWQTRWTLERKQKEKKKKKLQHTIDSCVRHSDCSLFFSPGTELTISPCCPGIPGLPGNPLSPLEQETETHLFWIETHGVKRNKPDTTLWLSISFKFLEINMLILKKNVNVIFVSNF